MLWAIIIVIVLVGLFLAHDISTVGHILGASLDELHEKVDALQEKLDEIEAKQDAKNYVNPIEL